MKKALFSALTLALLYGCASTPVEPEKPAAPSAQPAEGLPVSPPIAARPVQPAPQVDLSKRSVFYEYDKYDIRDEYRPVLQVHGKYLAENRGKKMLIQGNCDERGSREYNLALGARRAQAVKRALELAGADGNRIAAISYGAEKPVATGKDEANYSQNRRADIVY